MKTGARLQAAVEILDEIATRHRPAAEALSDWGRTHRFAGSGDRSSIGNLVYDVLRRRQSLAAIMGSDQPRAMVLGAARHAFGMTRAEIEASADGSAHVISALSDEEAAGLDRDLGEATPAYIRGDFPEWLAPHFERVFGASAAREGEALARRAPVDLRVNTLRSDRDKVSKALAKFGAMPTPFSPNGVRIVPPAGGGRSANVEADASHGRGWFEVQDEGSQIAALMADVGPRRQVLDLCAGAGGKTLALAAQMQNTGQIYAYDSERQRLRPIFERLKRAGARNVQVLEGGDEAALIALGARFDLVLVDAPCSGSGVWRRRPDAKWRLRPASLEERCAEQRAVLDLGARMVKPGGRLVYVTCSVLPQENVDQIEAFKQRHPLFVGLPTDQLWRAHLPGDPPSAEDGERNSLLLTPARHGTDGFFIAGLTAGA